MSDLTWSGTFARCHPIFQCVGYDMGYFSHCLTNAVCLPERQVDLQYFADIRSISADILINNKIDAIIHLFGDLQ